jgi:hypothetical protein
MILALCDIVVEKLGGEAVLKETTSDRYEDC